MTVLRPTSVRWRRKCSAAVTSLRCEIENSVRILIDEQRRFTIVLRPDNLNGRRKVTIRNTFGIVNVQCIYNRVIGARCVECVKISSLSIVLEDDNEWRRR